ncbi:unnamed protein product [Amoebophrya sp. A120]|nr:unnamed protein product [Amoebophrya sp. A120]|eukprot:GSA120T00021657001.1
MQILEWQDTLGQGAFATVRRAIVRLQCTDATQSSVVAAVKSISTKSKSTTPRATLGGVREGSHHGTRREMQILEQLQHPFLPVLLGSVARSDAFHLAFAYPREMCDLGTVLEMRGGRGLPSARAVAWCGLQVAEALHYVHSKQIVHRDLKPENVLLSPLGYLQVIDFGAAKPLDACSGRTYTVCGSPAYLAPEVLQERGHGLPVDLWQLGVLLAELWTGKPPFAGESLYEDILEGAFSSAFAGFLRSHTEERHSRPQDSPVGEQQDLSVLVTRILLRRNPRDRPLAQNVIAHKVFQDFDLAAMKEFRGACPFRLEELAT